MITKRATQRKTLDEQIWKPIEFADARLITNELDLLCFGTCVVLKAPIAARFLCLREYRLADFVLSG